MSALPDESDGRLYAAKCVDQYRSVMAVGGSKASLQRVSLPTMGLTGATALRKKGIDRKRQNTHIAVTHAPSESAKHRRPSTSPSMSSP